jgi:2-dehydropantoate 2-reductase
MRIAIMGTGGVGGYLGVRLGASGQDVAFIARGSHLAAMREHGLALESALGHATLHPVQASDDPAAIGPVDVVLLTVKLYDVEAAAQAARPLLGPDTAVVTLQNGVESPAMVGRILGEPHVVGGVAQIAAVIGAPGRIRHTGIEPRFIFGEMDGRRTPRVEALAGALAAAGVGHEISPAIEVDLWRKMVFLSTLSGLTALTRLPIGRLRSVPATRALLRTCLEEAAAVGRARGVALPAEAAEVALSFMDRLPESNRSSMLDDLERGRRLELPWLSGAIVRLGEEAGVPTPTHRFIASALEPHVGGRG